MYVISVSAWYLGELPGDTDGPAEAIAADQKGLHAPPPKVAERKDVKVAQDPLPSDHMTVHRILLSKTRDAKFNHLDHFNPQRFCMVGQLIM